MEWLLYHISVSTGKPEKCHAQSPDTCPFGMDSPHSTSKDELMEEVQRLGKEESGGVLAGMNNKLDIQLDQIHKEYDDVSNLEECDSLDLSTSLNNTMRDIKMKQYSEGLYTTSDAILNPRVVDFEKNDPNDLSIVGEPDEGTIFETVYYEGDLKTKFGDYTINITHVYHMPKNPDPSRYYLKKYPVTYDVVGGNISNGYDYDLDQELLI